MIWYEFTLWFGVFLSFMWLNVYTKSRIFGAVAGLWLMLLGFGILTSNIYVPTGYTETIIDNTTKTITYNYAVMSGIGGFDITYIFGMFFIGLSIYLLYRNILQLTR